MSGTGTDMWTVDVRGQLRLTRGGGVERSRDLGVGLWFYDEDRISGG